MESKIFFFCPALVAGGLERVLSVLSTPIAAHYSHVEYIMWHDKPVFYEIDKRVKIVSVEKECGYSNILKRILWFKRYVINARPDLVISFSAPFNMIALTALAGSHIKVVVSERIDPLSFRWGYCGKIARNILYLTANGIIVQTETIKRKLWSRLLGKVTVIPNPIIMDRSCVGCALESPKEHLIVSVSRLVPQKRLDLLIDTFKEFLRSYPDYQLVIYGWGKEQDNLQRQIEHLLLQGKVLMAGAVNDVWEKMKSAEMFVMTSEFEGMSNALLEAMSLGLPCISTKVSGAIEVVRNGKNGLLVDVNDAGGLLNAMCTLAADKDMRHDLGSEATKIADDYHIDKNASLWIDYIDKMVKDES